MLNVSFIARAPHQVKAASGLIEGMSKHGITARIDPAYRPCDLAVFWGHRQFDVIRRQREARAHYLVMERGYVGDRFHWTSLGFDGLNGRAKFPEVKDGGERWKKYFSSYIKPWHNGGRYAVIMGQVRGDASLMGVNFDAWLVQTYEKVKALGYEPVFRPHPQYRQQAVRFPRLDGSLSEALAVASMVCTYNSNSGVDGVLAGVPTVTSDQGSMAWDVTSHDPGYLITPDRSEWCEKMAYTQWSPEEIQSGLAWEHLKGVIQCQ